MRSAAFAKESAGEAASARHFAIAVAVLIAAAVLGMDAVAWGVLLLCIAGVLAAEMFNTALENLAKAIRVGEDQHIRDALDIASGAVLTAAFGSIAVGVAIFGHRAGQLLGWWN